MNTRSLECAPDENQETFSPSDEEMKSVYGSSEKLFEQSCYTSVPVSKIPADLPHKLLQNPSEKEIGGVSRCSADVVGEPDNPSRTITQPGAMAVRGNSETETNNSTPVDGDRLVQSQGHRHIAGEGDFLVEASLVRENGDSDPENGVEKAPPELIDARKLMSKKRRKVMWLSILLFGFVGGGILAGILIGVVFKDDGSSTINTATIFQASAAPSIAPTSAPTFEKGPSAVLDRIFRLIPPFSVEAIEADPQGPQARALNWLSLNANVMEYSDERVVQRFALATIFYSTDGPSTWTNTSGWVTDAHECTWYFAFPPEQTIDHCDGDELQILQLEENGMSGTLPPEVGLLSGLRVLRLVRGALSGAIPSTVGLLTMLQELAFFYNTFTGTVPTTVGLLTKLTSLDFSEIPTLDRK